jgi:uncharacterized membrane protein YgdD (TMEM256/DUF423 family)
MYKKFIAIGSLLGALSVSLGAFAAHSLKKILPPETLQIFETAVRYQFYHVFAIIIAGLLYTQFPLKQILWAGNCFIAGIIVFSGSLYVLCVVKHFEWHANWIGAITPLGGLFFISGWVLLAIAALKK